MNSQGYGWGELPAAVPEEDSAEHQELLEQEQRKAQYAQAFLDSDVYAQVMDSMHKSIHANIDHIEPSNTEAMQQACLQLKALRSFDSSLRDMADTGRLAAEQSNLKT